MKFLELFFGFAFCATGFAEGSHYKIMAQLFVRGRLVSTSQLLINEGEEAQVNTVSENPHREVKFNVVAFEATSDRVKEAILLKFEMEYFNGVKTRKASPEILAKAGVESTISMGDKAANRKMEMKVIVTRE